MTFGLTSMNPLSEMVQNEEANTDYTELMEGVDRSQDVEIYEHTQPIATRLSTWA